MSNENFVPMRHLKKPRTILLGLALLAATFTVKSQVSPFLPQFRVRSAIITYDISFPSAPDPSAHPCLRITFDRYGELQAKEYLDETSMLMNNGPFREIFVKDEIFILETADMIAKKYKLKDFHYMAGGDEGFIKFSQDLVSGKINKLNTPTFTSFRKTGEKKFLGFPCQAYEFLFEGHGTRDKMELMLYHDICLSKKYYIQDSLYYALEAKSYSENISVPPSVFAIADNYRIIDGDKLEASKEDVNYPYSTVVVEYSSLSSVGQIKQEGKKTLYIRNNGKSSSEEFTGSLCQFDLHPEKKHYKNIQDEEYEYVVDFINHDVRRRTLAEGNFDDKSIAERNYIFTNNLYDNSVKLTGKTNYLGKDCLILELRIMQEKLEVYEWCGIFLKIRKFMCYDDDCTQPVLLLEENATRINVNIPIDKSQFEYPDEYQLIIE